MPARPRGRRSAGHAPARPEFALCGRIERAGRLIEAEVGLDESGSIVRVAKDVRAYRRHDVGQSVILPAATDLHVHFRDPGPVGSVESLTTGSLSAAFAGVGTVADMPNTTPPVITREDVDNKGSRARGRLAVDLLVFAALTERTRVETVARSAGAFKLYLSPTSGIDQPPPPEAIPELLRAVARTGMPLTVHAEDPTAFSDQTAPLDGLGWNAARPPRAELRALDLLSSAPTALRMHIAHVTLEEVLDRVRERGWSCEVTPLHLLWSAELARDARWKVNPPLRPREEQRRMWERFAAGDVPCMASDHAPHSLEEKHRRWDEAPSGVPGVETGLPLLLERVRTGDLRLDVLLATAVERPARWLGLPVGRIAPGHRGHLIVVDFKERSRIEATRLHAACGWTPFEGYEAVFPAEHYHDGELIVEHGEYVGHSAGAVVRPEYAPGALPVRSGTS